MTTQSAVAIPLPTTRTTGGRPRPLSVFAGRRRVPAELHVASADGIEASFVVPSGSSVFDGHYPDHPLLPGVYMIEAAQQAVEAVHAMYGLGPMRLTRIRNLQLMQAVAPDQWLRLHATRVDNTHASDSESWRIALRHDEHRVAAFTLTFCSSASEQLAEARIAVEESANDGMKAIYGSADILSLLAHRPPMLLIDHAIRLPAGDELFARKAISLNEPCYLDVEPNGAADSAYPSSLVVESFTQAAGLLALGCGQVFKRTNERQPLMVFGGLSDARFLGCAEAGETLQHRVRISRSFGDALFVSGSTCTDTRMLADFTGLLVIFRDREALASPRPLPATNDVAQMTDVTFLPQP